MSVGMICARRIVAPGAYAPHELDELFELRESAGEVLALEHVVRAEMHENDVRLVRLQPPAQSIQDLVDPEAPVSLRGPCRSRSSVPGRGGGS